MSEIVLTEQHVSYAAASEVLSAALAKADEMGLKVGVVVVDGRGDVVAMGKSERSGGQMWRGGLMKATAAARLGRSTEDFVEHRLKQDEVLWRAMSGLPELFLVPGGIPLIHEGVTIGAIGVSGARYVEDTVVAQAGADRFAEISATA